MILSGLKDPRVPKMASVLRVDLARDLSHAKVYVSVLGSARQQAEALDGLNNAGGYIRRELGKMVEIRTMPQLHFVLDDSIEYGIHMNQVFDELNHRED